MNEWERMEKERKLREQTEATAAFINMILDELTKAKDLLKRCYENYIYLEPLRSEIEQFLKESE